MDLITDLPKSVDAFGNEYDAILTFVDLLTKQAFFVRTKKSIDSVGLAHLYLENVYRLKGLSRLLVSDRDVRITAEFWRTLMLRLGTELNLSTTYHPETDGQAERTHRTIEQILRAYVNSAHDDWATWLPVAEFAYNQATHAAIKVSPFEANYGYKPDTPASLAGPLTAGGEDYAERIRLLHNFVQREAEAAKVYMEAYASKTRKDVWFQPGDRVWLDSSVLSLREQPSKKLRDRWVGPYEVLRVVNPVSYELALPVSLARVHPVFHVSRLKRDVESESEFTGRPVGRRPKPVVTDFAQNEKFDVEKLLDVRIGQMIERGRNVPVLQFLVRWAAPYQDPKWDSWEPFSALRHNVALPIFVCSPQFVEFKSSPEYEAYVQRFPRRVPK
jgi:hypothetical protein